MGIQIEQAAINTYVDQVRNAPQQMTSVFAGNMTEGDYVGEKISEILELGTASGQEQESRAQRIAFDDPSMKRRWILPRPLYYDAIPIETQDQVKMLTQVQGGYAMAQMADFGRYRDKCVIEGAFGTAYVGKTGTDTATFDANQIIAASVGAAADTGLNYDKFVACNELIMKNEVQMLPGDFKVAVLAARQVANMAKQAEAISERYKISVQWDAMGNLIGFDGWKILRTELLPLASGIRSCLFYVKSGLHGGFWKRPESKVYDDTTLVGHPKVAYAHQMFNGTRTHEKKVLKVQCAEA